MIRRTFLKFLGLAPFPFAGLAPTVQARTPNKRFRKLVVMTVGEDKYVVAFLRNAGQDVTYGRIPLELADRIMEEYDKNIVTVTHNGKPYCYLNNGPTGGTSLHWYHRPAGLSFTADDFHTIVPYAFAGTEPEINAELDRFSTATFQPIPHDDLNAARNALAMLASMKDAKYTVTV